MRKLLLLVVVPVALSGCQTWGPTWSEVSGNRYYHTMLHRTPTIIETVDGRSERPSGYAGSIKIEPGRHLLTLQGIPERPGWQGYVKPFTLDAEPCRRYFINAQFEGALQPSDWMPVIDYVEPIAGCRVASSQ